MELLEFLHDKFKEMSKDKKRIQRELSSCQTREESEIPHEQMVDKVIDDSSRQQGAQRIKNDDAKPSNSGSEATSR